MMSVSPPGQKRKARDLNPHGLAAARFSRPARPTVSGYLPSIRPAPCTGLEPVSPARQTGRHTRCVTGRSDTRSGLGFGLECGDSFAALGFSLGFWGRDLAPCAAAPKERPKEKPKAAKESPHSKPDNDY